ncbi:hypothetical protein JXJ21_12935 [candidate division KSB1 bacterium]|nr:hypothetical protein [candidate division KSB1 bacterium]
MQTNSPDEKPEIAPLGDLDDLRKRHDPKSLNGVPLGGFGTGKIEITPDGSLRHFTTNNNTTYPLDGMPGTFLGAKIENHPAKILQTNAIPFFPKESYLQPNQIACEGLYPVNHLQYALDGDIELALTAFAAMSPLDYENAMKPGAYFIFNLKNNSKLTRRATLLFSWENINGCWGDKVAWDDWVPKTPGVLSEDRFNNQLYEDDLLEGIFYQATQEHPEYKNFCIGNFALLWEISDNAKLSFQSLNPYDGGSVRQFMSNFDSHALANQIQLKPGEFSAALAVTVDLHPGEKRDEIFLLTWYMPNDWGFGDGDVYSRTADITEKKGGFIGHFYNNHFDSALDVARSMAGDALSLLNKVRAWQNCLLQSSLPEWFSKLLINNTYVLSTNFFWAEDGRVVTLESPLCPCYGTLDQRFYGSITQLLFFPSLERREMELYRWHSDIQWESRRKYKGQIYHDFGNNRMDAFNHYGWNWMDLNTKFILLLYRNYLLTGDRNKLLEMYPKIKEVVERILEADENGDGLPEGYGNCNTYEGKFFGTNSYDSSLVLAALSCVKRIAALFDDDDYLAHIRDLIERGKAAFEKLLWDEQLGYYIKCTETADEPDKSPAYSGDLKNAKSCRDDQLTGKWYADFLELDPVFNETRAARALASIIDINAVDTEHGPFIRQQVNRGDETPGACWPGFIFGHLCSYAISNKQADFAMEVAETIYRLIHETHQQAFDQPIGLRPDKKSRGDRYQNSPSAWYMLFALEGAMFDLDKGKIHLKSSLPRAFNNRLSAPLLTAVEWGWLNYEIKSNRADYEVAFPNLQFYEITIGTDAKARQANIRVNGKGIAPKTIRIQAHQIYIELEEPVTKFQVEVIF